MSDSHTALPRTLILLVVAFVFVTGLQVSQADDSPSVSTSSREGRLIVFDDVWETIQERYYDPSFHGVDWQAKRSTFRPLAADAVSEQEFYEVLRQMIVSLRDPHTRVYSPEEKFDWWNPKFVTVGATIREVEGQPTVVYVTPNSAAARAQLRAGDVITAVNKIPAQQLINQRLKALNLALDEPDRLRATATLLEGSDGSSVSLTWVSEKGETKTATLRRSWTEKRLGFQITRSGNLAIIKVEVFTAETSRELVRALPKALHNASGIVLDLRANGGGDAQAMAEVASAFFAQGLDLGNFTDRAGVSFALQTQLLSALPPQKQTRLRMVVLTSEGTSSAAEILAAALQKTSRARVVGTQTCGCVLAIRNRHELPDGGILDVSELDYRTAEGARLEGIGVNPDAVQVMHRKDLYKGRDAQLMYAEKLLKR
ncbi:MAG: hypothetical protein C5B55_08145 [Blastocatellia bacterium]|nr:MAG: hypothetical protein C5B55_08145 [Blastocatellia bacterium]